MTSWVCVCHIKSRQTTLSINFFLSKHSFCCRILKELYYKCRFPCRLFSIQLRRKIRPHFYFFRITQQTAWLMKSLCNCYSQNKVWLIFTWRVLLGRNILVLPLIICKKSENNKRVLLFAFGYFLCRWLKLHFRLYRSDMWHCRYSLHATGVTGYVLCSVSLSSV